MITILYLRPFLSLSRRPLTTVDLSGSSPPVESISSSGATPIGTAFLVFFPVRAIASTVGRFRLP